MKKVTVADMIAYIETMSCEQYTQMFIAVVILTGIALTVAKLLLALSKYKRK